jgi:CrcB protein
MELAATALGLMAPTPVQRSSSLADGAEPKGVGMDRGRREAVPYRRRRRPGIGLAHQARPKVLAVIALGGALGAAARYGVAQAIPVTGTTGFPWATFWTNVSGSLALGVILTLVLERFPPTRYLRPFLATGFLGAFTTYSTFAAETDLLAVHGAYVRALAYAIGSLAAGFVAVWIGMVSARVVPLGSLGRHGSRPSPHSRRRGGRTRRIREGGGRQ